MCLDSGFFLVLELGVWWQCRKGKSEESEDEGQLNGNDLGGFFGFQYF